MSDQSQSHIHRPPLGEPLDLMEPVPESAREFERVFSGNGHKIGAAIKREIEAGHIKIHSNGKVTISENCGPLPYILPKSVLKVETSDETKETVEANTSEKSLNNEEHCFDFDCFCKPKKDLLKCDKARAAWHGWTLNLNQGWGMTGWMAFTFGYDSLTFLDASVEPATFNGRQGNVCNQRDVAPAPFSGDLDLMPPMPTTAGGPLNFVSENLLVVEDVFGLAALGLNGIIPAVVQPETSSIPGLIYILDCVVANNLAYLAGPGIAQRINEPPFPIRPWGFDDSFPDANNRVFMFEQAVDIMTKNQNPQRSTDRDDFDGNGGTPTNNKGGYIGKSRMEAVRRQIIYEGILRPPFTVGNHPNDKIHKTTKSSGSTSFLVGGKFHGLNEASRVTVCGFKGEWERVNTRCNENYCVLFADLSMFSMNEQPQYYNTDKVTYRFALPVDTEDLPEWDPEKHGRPTITPLRHGPVTADIEYREWMAALWEFFLQVFGIGQHSAFDEYYTDSNFNKLVSTWDEVKEQLNGTVSLNRTLTRTRNPGPKGSWWYNNAAASQSRAGSSLPPLNEPFLELGTGPGEIPGAYNVSKENYLDDVRYLYFRIQPGSPVTLPIHAVIWTFGVGYAASAPNGGSRFEGLASSLPFSEYWANLPENPDEWTTYNNGYAPQNYYDTNDVHYAGMIKESLIPSDSPHKKIGYVRFGNTTLIDPVGFGGLPEFGAPNTPLQNREGFLAVFAAYTRYFNEKGATKVIIDCRRNGGGQSLGPFAELFGGDRLNISFVTSYQSRDERATVNTNDQSILGYQGNPSGPKVLGPLQNPNKFYYPSVAEQLHPGSVFKNGEVVILTSNLSFSGGDVLPRLFMGDNADGDLGSIEEGKNVQAKVAGEIDGRLRGCSINNGVITTSSTSEFTNSSGNPTRWFRMRNDGICQQDFSGVPGNIRTQFNGKPLPFYTVAKPLSNELEDTVYIDFGETPYPQSEINRLPNLPNGGQPKKDDPTTWRDTWLEEAIC